MLKVKNLSYRYGDGKPLSFNDFELAAGYRLLVLGESGSGKTTLLHLIAGILRPGSGTVTINGTELSQLQGGRLDLYRGRHIGMVFQRQLFLQGLSVFDNLVAARRFAGLPEDRAYLDELTASLGISALKHKRPQDLSQGEQQRFGIARALANRPLLVLADEPTSSLDDRNCDRFTRLIREEPAGHQACWIIATHDRRLKKDFGRVYGLEGVKSD